MNEIRNFNNEELGLQIRTMLNEDGSISMNAEDTAIGFGWTQKQVKNGKEYNSTRWETLNSYCEDLGFPNKLGKEDYIPESLFYMLGMKAGNERALKYQTWLAMEVLPSLRKTGSYTMNNDKKESAATISLKEQVECIPIIATDLHINDASRILMYNKLYKSYHLPTDFLPQYEFNGGRQLLSLTALIKKNDRKTTAAKLNQIFLQVGILEERSRPSKSSKTGVKTFKMLTNKGLRYGENATTPNNQQEIQPLYYEDSFTELFESIRCYV